MTEEFTEITIRTRRSSDSVRLFFRASQEHIDIALERARQILRNDEPDEYSDNEVKK